MFGLASAIATGAMNAGMAGLQMVNENQNIEKQNQFNIDMWKMQNDYNSPQAQMRRLSDAGLNPNLMYGMGNVGNASSPPQKNAPDYSKSIDYLSKAFNIEGLLTANAHRKEAQENARIAELKRFDAEDMRTAQTDFGRLYSYNPRTGRYEWTNYDVEVNGKNPRGHRPGDAPTNEYWFNNQFMNSEKNWLNPFREALISGQTGLIPARKALLNTQRNVLAPQVTMQNYNARFYPYSYWIGNGQKIVNSLGEVTSWFNPSRYFMPLKPGTRLFGPTGSIYY